MIELPKKMMIDDAGQLWDGGSPVKHEDICAGWDNRWPPSPGHITCTHSQIGGGRIESVAYRGVDLRRHVDPSGRAWWSAPGSLCTPKDIDEARRLRKQLAEPRERR